MESLFRRRGKPSSLTPLGAERRDAGGGGGHLCEVAARLQSQSAALRYLRSLLRPIRTRPATPAPSSTSIPGSGMKWIFIVANSESFSLLPDVRFVTICIGEISCTTPDGCAVLVVVELGSCANPDFTMLMNFFTPIGVIGVVISS